MKVIGRLGTIDRLFGVPVTTRNWNTITSIARMLGEGARGRTGDRRREPLAQDRLRRTVRGEARR